MKTKKQMNIMECKFAMDVARGKRRIDAYAEAFGISAKTPREIAILNNRAAKLLERDDIVSLIADEQKQMLARRGGEVKAKKRNYTLHWKMMEPYNFFIVVAAGPDIDGIKKELRRAFTKPKGSDEPMLDEYFDNAHVNPDEIHTKDGLTIFDEKSDNIVIYCKDIRPPLPTLAHELYHAVRESARNFGFEQSRHDEAEAYLFERAFEYFAGKIEEDCRAMTGAEQDKGGRK